MEWSKMVQPGLACQAIADDVHRRGFCCTSGRKQADELADSSTDPFCILFRSLKPCTASVTRVTRQQQGAAVLKGTLCADGIKQSGMHTVLAVSCWIRCHVTCYAWL
jgi:hypothetical protein